jgi:hypothetical protein
MICTIYYSLVTHAAKTHLYPCGRVTRKSRTWVIHDIYALPEYGGGTDHINDGQSLITDDIKKL